MTSHDKLRELAQAATPGPWVVGDGPGPGSSYFGTAFIPDDPSELGIMLGEADTVDAEFIAEANPTAVLALLDELRDAKADAWDECARWFDQNGGRMDFYAVPNALKANPHKGDAR